MPNKTFSIFIFAFLIPIITFAKVQATPARFNQLPGWKQNNFIASLNTFKKSCQALLPQKKIKNFGTLTFPVSKQQLKVVCNKASRIKKPTQAQAQRFFEKYFKAVAISDNKTSYGLFTAYYLPIIYARKVKTKMFSVPIYARPKNLITAKLGQFRLKLKGEKIAGRVVNGRLYPYNTTRYQINNGALKNKATALLWTKTRADRFFLQIQGSGIAILPDGKKVFLGYDGETNANYYAIGRWLAEKGLIARDKISLQTIYAWLLKNPKQAIKLMNRNQSFVFFKILPRNEVYGTNKIPLTPYYSLAVDNKVIPLGLPVYLSTTLPSAKNKKRSKPFNRLMIAQDTGGAIHGAVRGDVYLGAGKQAGLVAGRMRQRGRFWVFVIAYNKRR